MKKFENYEAITAELVQSMGSDDAERQEKAFTDFVDALQADITARANAAAEAERDGRALEARGLLKPLTAEERKYFSAVIERKGFEHVEEAFPKTIVNEVLLRLKTEHPLLSRIDIKETGMLAEIIVANPTKAKAFWGPICSDIKQLILDGFTVKGIKHSKLSGFIATCKGMMDLGPDWLAEYVRESMYEIMAASLEDAVINGNGKDMPIGMMMKLTGAVDGKHAEKKATAITDFKPTTMASFRAALAEAKLDSKGVAIIVNPITYWSKVFSNLAYQTNNGTWVLDRLATGEEIIESYAVPVDKLIIGDPKNYLLTVSTATEIKRYDQTLAIEDMYLDIAKFTGYGLPKDMNAFFVADVSGAPAVTKIELEVETPVA